ncbi:(Fe-S)-binding protein, partial [Chloroflexota bacterium]
MDHIRKIIAETNAYSCVDCGKCTVACPVAQRNPEFAPRGLVDELHGEEQAIITGHKLWDCITCGRCEIHCPSDVKFAEMVKHVRGLAYDGGRQGQCTHGGALDSLMHLMGAPGLKQDRLGWLDSSMKTNDKSDTYYFVGCLPFFDVIFAHLGVKMTDTAKGAVHLMNRLDIEPGLFSNERCCGHDLLWAGDVEGFKKLAEMNMKEIAKSGAKRVVTTCPECYYTLAVEYPYHIGDSGVEVVHISQLLGENEQAEKIGYAETDESVTFQDPCRLGRFSGVYDAPRTAIEAVPGLELKEMEHNRAKALCCGTQAWINCGSVNKQIQADRLHEAAATGVELLLTACPKCQIHLSCALQDGKLDGELNIRIEDM